MSLITPFPFRTEIVYSTPGQPPVTYLGGNANVGLMRSLDYGRTWEQKVPEGFNDWASTRGFAGRAFARSDQPDWVYRAVTSWDDIDTKGCAGYGLHRSTDGGAPWQETNAGLGAVLPRTIAFSPFNADEAYAATQAKGILRTPDGSRRCQSMSVPMGNHRASIAPDPFTDGLRFFGYGDLESVPIVRVSGDHGATYTENALALPPEYADKRAYPSAIAPDASTQDRLLTGVCVEKQWPAVGPGLIYASIDGGSTWSQQSTPTRHGLLALRRQHERLALPHSHPGQSVDAVRTGRWSFRNGDHRWFQCRCGCVHRDSVRTRQRPLPGTNTSQRIREILRQDRQLRSVRAGAGSSLHGPTA